jgi:hypothetical protein
MKNNALAFKFLDVGESIPIGSKWISCHLVFNVKMDLTRKARFVAGGHWLEPDETLSFSTVVTRESVRIMFTIAALNKLCSPLQL